MAANPPRPARLHIPVVQLVVPEPWRVGQVEFRPPRSLDKLTSRRRPMDEAETQFIAWAQEGIKAHPASTAAVPVLWPDDSASQVPVRERAIEQVRDALAVLRLYKRARYPVLPTDVQEFGVHGDIGSALQWTTVTRGRNIIGTGARWLGIIGDWTFSPADAREFRADRRFAYLDDALRRPIRRTELQRRALTAVRVRAMSTAMIRPQLQVILLGTALEALLAEEVGAGERRARGEFYRIAQRASYLICGEPDQRYPNRRPCFYLEARTEAAMKRAFEGRALRGEDPRCSAFDHVFGLMKDRNEALHTARESFERSVLGWHGITTDQVILYTLDWATSRGARTLAQLDAELDAFVRGGVARA